jgi:hypothetical protein
VLCFYGNSKNARQNNPVIVGAGSDLWCLECGGVVRAWNMEGWEGELDSDEMRFRLVNKQVQLANGKRPKPENMRSGPLQMHHSA